ncbi:L,D-transpeptidase [Nocardia sp. XZ_19_385]|uniref:L,D-transpeptidase family protein n=1 Tax=Nocardia sp. XZ_19_385 TaxID=2769488 RepID=UPI001E658DC8|nr:L,D-transpeptidase family protein [Nocardia sp. XZ_19_385]
MTIDDSRFRLRSVLCLALAMVALSGAPAQAAALPVPYDGPAGQVVTVLAPGSSSTTAVLEAWERQGSRWIRALGPFPAFVGAEGVGEAREAVARTPAGVWALSHAFGNRPGNGTRLPYRQVTPWDWWVGDSRSLLYNMPFLCPPGLCPFNESVSERLGAVGYAYDRAVVMDYNRWPARPGHGSAFFLHVSTGEPTAGCVAIAAPDLDAVMRWLDPAAHPVIAIAAQQG